MFYLQVVVEKQLGVTLQFVLQMSAKHLKMMLTTFIIIIISMSSSFVVAQKKQGKISRDAGFIF